MDRKGYEQSAIDGVNTMLDPMAKGMAGSMGMPPGGKRYTQADIDNLWNYSPIADPQARVQAMLSLKQLGKTDEEITDAVYPNRRTVITSSRAKASEQIAFAKSQGRRMEKLAAEQGMPSPTMPEQPSMPESMQPSVPTPPAQSFAPEIAPTPAPQPAAPSILDQPFSMGGL